MINTTGLHKNTRKRFKEANNEFKALTGNDFTIVSTLKNIPLQAENVISILSTGLPLEDLSLPGCHLLNYGIGAKVDVADNAVNLLNNPSFEELMARHELIPVSDHFHGDYVNSVSPHLSSIRDAINELQEANSGLAWLWEKAVKDFIEAEQELIEKQEELDNIDNQFIQLNLDWAAWRERRDTLIQALNITVAIFQQRLALLTDLYHVSEYIRSLEAERNQLDIEAEVLDDLISAHDEEVQRYNNAVAAHNNAIDEWVRRGNELEDTYNELMADSALCDRDPSPCSATSIQELNDRIDQYHDDLLIHEAQYDALQQEGVDLVNWDQRLSVQEERLIAAANALSDRYQQNENKLNSANTVKQQILNALDDLPELTTEFADEYEWLVIEQVRLTNLEAYLTEERDSITNEMTRLNSQKDDASSRQDRYLQEIIDFVNDFNFSTRMSELGDLDSSAKKLKDMLDHAEKADYVREIIEESGGLPDGPDDFKDKFGIYEPLFGNDKFKDIFTYKKYQNNKANIEALRFFNKHQAKSQATQYFNMSTLYRQAHDKYKRDNENIVKLEKKLTQSILLNIGEKARINDVTKYKNSWSAVSKTAKLLEKDK